MVNSNPPLVPAYIPQSRSSRLFVSLRGDQKQGAVYFLQDSPGAGEEMKDLKATFGVTSTSQRGTSMWGWKTADRVVEPSVSFDAAKEILQDEGFDIVTSNPKHCILRRAGIDSGWKRIAPEGEDVPLELAIAEADRGLFFQIRYDHFVLFDTGDLERLADELARVLGAG